MRWWRALVLLVALGGAPASFAVQPDEILGDPALEARARVLSRELRCMVCQNQSIDDSDAGLARDLRLLVRERLQAGENGSDTTAQPQGPDPRPIPQGPRPRPPPHGPPGAACEVAGRAVRIP